MTAPVGECVITRHTDIAADYLTVDHADPRVWISADLILEIGVLTARDEPRFTDLVGDVLTIHGRNRRVVYRIDWTTWNEATDSYLAEWPD